MLGVKMNSLLNEYADNPIIDEVVYWPPRNVRQIIVKQRPLGIEVVFIDNTRHFTEFNKSKNASFENWRQEAWGILNLITNIELVDEISKEPTATYPEELAQGILKRREELIGECTAKLRGHENDDFTTSWFTEQFGFNCANLPKPIEEIVRNVQKNT